MNDVRLNRHVVAATTVVLIFQRLAFTYATGGAVSAKVNLGLSLQCQFRIVHIALILFLLIILLIVVVDYVLLRV